VKEPAAPAVGDGAQSIGRGVVGELEEAQFAFEGGSGEVRHDTADNRAEVGAARGGGAIGKGLESSQDSVAESGGGDYLDDSGIGGFEDGDSSSIRDRRGVECLGGIDY